MPVKVWGLFFVVLAASACSPGPPDDAEYLQKIQSWRAERDKTWGETTDPIPANRRAELLPLRYFPADPSYAVPAELKLSDTQPVVELQVSVVQPLESLHVTGVYTQPVPALQPSVVHMSLSLQVTGVYTQIAGSNPDADRHCGVVDPWVADFEPVAIGSCKFALVTGSNALTGLGTNSAGAARANTNPCP